MPIFARLTGGLIGLGGIAAGLAFAAAPAASARTQVTPYIEAAQVLNADLNGGEVLTYTSLAAGVDGRAVSRRVEAQISYRYERRIDWNGGGSGADDAHSGVVMVRAALVPNAVAVEAGALATRYGAPGFGPGAFAGSNVGGVQVYSAYAGPSVSHQAGPVSVNAHYRLGYVHIEDDDFGAPGSPARRRAPSDAVAHSAGASIGMSPGELPVGWTVGVGYAREDSGHLDHRFEGKFVRADVVVPVGPDLAVTGGVGYETIEASQSDFVRNEAGLPVLGPDGRPIADPSRPRLLAYDQDGIFWDAGIIWRPTRRTELQARAGQRYGGTVFLGSLQHRFRDDLGLGVQVFDSVDTFGRRMIDTLSGLPSNFTIRQNPFTGGVNGCVFGEDPGSGVCFDQALVGMTNSSFRNRGATALLSGRRGPWSWGAGLGYAHRRYFQPVSGDLGSLGPRRDQSVTANLNLGRQLSRESGIGLDAYASWYDSDTALDPAFSTGVTGSYYRSFLIDRLRLLAALGLYTSDAGESDTTNASALVGLRYSF